jgi:hypothetical protein
VVGVLQQVQRLLDAAGPEVEGEHRFDVRLAGPAHELVEPEGVGLDAVPGEVEPGGPGLHRPNAILPPVAGHEVAARIADQGDAEIANQLEHVAPEPVVVGRRMIGLVDAGVDTPAHVLDERTERPPVDRRDHERRIERQRCCECPIHEITSIPSAATRLLVRCPGRRAGTAAGRR